MKAHTNICLDPEVLAAAQARIPNLSGFVQAHIKAHLAIEDGVKETEIDAGLVAANTITQLKKQLVASQKRVQELEQEKEQLRAKYNQFVRRKR